jgi:hypothetical protein
MAKKKAGKKRGRKPKQHKHNPWDLSLYSASALETRKAGKRGRGRPKGSKGSKSKAGLVRAKQIYVTV